MPFNRQNQSLYTENKSTERAQAIFKFWFSLQLYTQIFIGLILGVAAGAVFGEQAQIIKPLGTAFIRLITMVVVPLVFASLVMGIVSLGDLSKIGKIGGKALGYFFVTTMFAITIGLLAAQLVQPGKGMDTSLLKTYQVSEANLQQLQQLESPSEQGLVDRELLSFLGSFKGQQLRHQDFKQQLSEKLTAAQIQLIFKYTEVKAATASLEEQARQKKPASQVLLEIIPTNPVSALNQANMLQIIFFAIFFGVSLTVIDPEKSKYIIGCFEAINDSMVWIVTAVMKIAPLGVFALIASIIGQFGLGILLVLFKYTITVILALIVHALFTYGGAVSLFSKISLRQFFKGIRPAQLIGFSTSSSSASLPVTMRCLEENIGVSKKVSSFVLPLGATVNMDGTALYQGVAAIFIAQVFGMDLSLTQQLSIVLTATMASIGAAGVPGAGMITLTLILSSLGIPLEGLALILGVDRVLDMFRTAVNVTGDASAAVIIADSEQEISLGFIQPG